MPMVINGHCPLSMGTMSDFQAVKTKSPIINLEGSLNAFLKEQFMATVL